MIIHQPTINKYAGEVTLSAVIETQKSTTGLPGQLWFRYPERYEYGVTDQSDGFLASLILMAMYLGEDLSIRGTTSPLLAYHIPKLVRTFGLLYPQVFQPVDVKFEQVQPISFESLPMDVGCAYSGGIDSNYTLHSHIDRNQPAQEFRLTHGVFIHGFDILLSQPDFYQLACARAQTALDELGMQLILVATNCYSFYQFRMDWVMAFMPPLIGVGLTLQKMFKRFYVSSSRSVHDKSDLSLFVNELGCVSNLSTDSCSILLHDNTVSRTEKIFTIYDWPIIYPSLRVCTKLVKPTQNLNCGRCPKCIVTMTYLELLGSLKYYTTFETSYSLSLIFRLAFLGRDSFIRARSLMKLALQKKRYDIFLTFCLVYIPGMLKMMSYFAYIRLLGLIPDSIKYNLKKNWFPHNEQ